MTTITESVVEEAALQWFAGSGRQTARGQDIASDAPNAEHSDYD